MPITRSAMTTLQQIKELQYLCKQGKFRTWAIGQTSTDSETWCSGWIHLRAGEATRFCTDTLIETLTEMLKFVKEEENDE